MTRPYRNFEAVIANSIAAVRLTFENSLIDYEMATEQLVKLESEPKSALRDDRLLSAAVHHRAMLLRMLQTPAMTLQDVLLKLDNWQFYSLEDGTYDISMSGDKGSYFPAIVCIMNDLRRIGGTEQ